MLRDLINLIADILIEKTFALTIIKSGRVFPLALPDIAFLSKEYSLNLDKSSSSPDGHSKFTKDGYQSEKKVCNWSFSSYFTVKKRF